MVSKVLFSWYIFASTNTIYVVWSVRNNNHLSGVVFIKQPKSNVYVSLTTIGSFWCNLYSDWLNKNAYRNLRFFMNTAPDALEMFVGQILKGKKRNNVYTRFTGKWNSVSVKLRFMFKCHAHALRSRRAHVWWNTGQTISENSFRHLISRGT